MRIKKLKVSELPLESTLKGLHTIGVNKENQSVKVSLEFVEKAADNANAAAESAETLEDKIKTAEAERKDAESTRVSNETARKSAETKRDNAEKIRISNEEERVLNEEERILVESTRISNERDRQSAETSRGDAESVRSSNENIRKENETVRVDAESTRVSNETARKSAETKRDNAEKIRVSNEEERVKEHTEVVANTNNAKTDAIQATKEAREAKDEALTAASKADSAATNANAEAHTAKELSDNPPKVSGSGTWLVYDLEQHKYVDSELSARARSPYIQDGTWWTFDDDTNKYINTEISVSSDYTLTKEKVENVLTGGIESHTHDVRYNTKEEMTDILLNYVRAIEGKQLSTEDFTYILKTKLEGLNNYDDTELQRALEMLSRRLDTLIGGSASEAIDTFNEITDFLSGLTDTENLTTLLAGLRTEIIKLIPTKPEDIKAADSVHKHIVKDITDLPEWTKQPDKPSYTAQEVGAATLEDIGKIMEEAGAGVFIPPFTEWDDIEPDDITNQIGDVTNQIKNAVEQTQSGTTYSDYGWTTQYFDKPFADIPSVVCTLVDPSYEKTIIKIKNITKESFQVYTAYWNEDYEDDKYWDTIREMFTYVAHSKK